MSLVLFHHPMTRAANAVWALEETEIPFSLHFVDAFAGEQKSPEILGLNPMGKLPILKDGDTVVTEAAAIGLYLADRYALGRLAPKPDDPRRGTYFRWVLFGPSVLEPAVMAKGSKWEVNEGAAGWGSYESMIQALSSALEKGPFLLGEEFSMADVVLGGTVRFLLQFKMLDALPAFEEYVERLTARPAYQRAMAKNAQVIEERGIKPW